jgi:hypothetical protein
VIQVAGENLSNDSILMMEKCYAVAMGTFGSERDRLQRFSPRRMRKGIESMDGFRQKESAE